MGFTQPSQKGASPAKAVTISSRCTFQTLDLTLGGIAEKPGVIDGQIVIREYLSMTLSFNHDLIDGAPAARFVQRLKELIESGYGLCSPDMFEVLIS